MADFTTVLASLILVITESTVERGQLAKLVTLELVLAFWNRGRLKVVLVEWRLRSAARLCSFL